MPQLFRKMNAKHHIDFLQVIKSDFRLISSNYTTAIESELWPEKYVVNFQSKRCFACFAKVKSDIKGKKVPDIKREDVRYFQHNFNRDLYIEEVINIDLKSAYATVLMNDRIISKATFDYISKSSKKERLASIGMLASKKDIFNFKEGEPVSQEQVVSDKSGFFFYAVQRTFEIMDDLKKICGDKYLYTWVDGIYFLPDKKVLKECLSLLSSYQFNYSIDYLSEFDVSIRPDHVLVTFKKEGKKKIFNLPNLSAGFKKIMLDAVMSLNKKHKNEKGSHQI